MKRLVLLFAALCLFLPSCSGKMKDIRLGNTYGVIRPTQITVYTQPSLESETFHLKDIEAFTIEDVLWPEEYGFSEKAFFFGEAAFPEDAPGLSKEAANRYAEKIRTGKAYSFRGFYKVRFESGMEGYLDWRLFYPELSRHLISEDMTKTHGQTATEYLSVFKRDLEEIKERIEAIEKDRVKAIELSPWPEEEKELLLQERVWIGMRSMQLALSLCSPSNRTETVTNKGTLEKWSYGNTVYHFENDKLIKWATVKVAEKMDATPKKYLIRAQKEMKAFRKWAEGIDRDRRKVIELSQWPEKEKELLLQKKVWIGMNSMQLTVSRYFPKKKTQTVTDKGTLEKWSYGKTIYYLENDKVIKWETLVK